MNVLAICLLVTVTSGISGNTLIRGDAGLLNPTGIRGIRDPQCYDKQVVKDQFFDNSFICYDNLTYPSAEIAYALRQPINREYFNYMNMIGMCLEGNCFAEKDFYLASKYVEKEYQLDCICKSNRKLFAAVYHNNQKCHVVDNQKQGIYHADCGGNCHLSYGHIEGYFCVNQGWARRTFLVYCEYDTAFNTFTHDLQFRNRPVGGFFFMTKEMPTYCGCRGYLGCR